MIHSLRVSLKVGACILSLLVVQDSCALAAEVDSFMGKPADDAAAAQLAAEEPLTPFTDSAGIDLPGPPPKPFTNLRNAVEFINHQRGLHGRGLPATFYVPSPEEIHHPLRQLIVTEGVGLYDTALAVIMLVEVGDLASAREILDIYVGGTYSPENTVPMELRSIPTSANGYAFSNFDSDAYYFFDFTNVSGNWMRWRDRWIFWTVHSGPNAWFINALCRYIEASRAAGTREPALQPYIHLAETVGKGMIRLQDSQALGGVRYGPQKEYVPEGAAAPFDQINSENNISAYVAFHMLYRVTQDPAWDQASQRILDWFQNAAVWTDQGHARRGLFDPATHTLAMGAEFHEGRWILQNDHPTDSGGTWTISSLGPAKIDELWGSRSAYEMWRTLRRRAGRTADFKWVKDTQELAGLDYTDLYPEEESMISPEWTAGGLFALKLLVGYYTRGAGQGALSPAEIQSLRDDARTMTAFIRQHANPYALGPGSGGKREGRTGFGWFAPPPDVQAMPSIYFALYVEGKSDPSGWWRQPPRDGTVALKFEPAEKN